MLDDVVIFLRRTKNKSAVIVLCHKEQTVIYRKAAVFKNFATEQPNKILSI